MFSGTITADLQSSVTTPFSKDTLHSLHIQSTTMSHPPFIISPVISSLPAVFAHSHLNLSSSNWLCSEAVTSPNPIKTIHVDCNLFMNIYIIQIFKILLPDLSHFVLPLYQPPISILYSAATPSKTISYFHSYSHSSSFQIVHLLYFCSEIFTF